MDSSRTINILTKHIKPNTQKERKFIMGTIIGEGITFDDVLLVPAFSEGAQYQSP